MAFPKFQTKEVLNKVLNAGEDALNVDLSDSVTVTVDSEFPAAAAITDNFANPTTTSAMSMLMGYDGSAWDRVTIGGGAEAAALRVTIASDSTGVVTVDDGGGALTVDGTVTANLSSTDNAVLDAMAASLALLDNSIASGSELQVDVVASLPAGDNNIGNVDIASSVGLTVDLGSNNDIQIASGQVASGAFVSGSVADGAMVTLGAKADAKSASTDGTSITAMQVLKQISASTQETATDTGTIDADTNAIKGHVDGIETLITSTNTKLDTLETTNNANQVLLGTIDSDTDATKTATEASQSALEKMLYGNALVITAVDGGSTQALGATYESLYVGVGGNVVVTMVGTGNFTFSNVASGQLLPIRITHVIHTNTTATNMIALKA